MTGRCLRVASCTSRAATQIRSLVKIRSWNRYGRGLRVLKRTIENQREPDTNRDNLMTNIVMLTKGRPKLMDQSLYTLNENTYMDFNLTIIDDGSNDEDFDHWETRLLALPRTYERTKILV